MRQREMFSSVAYTILS